ncbi:ankyrin repeat-containing domain protein, partial [Chytridium lagenaria]
STALHVAITNHQFGTTSLLAQEMVKAGISLDIPDKDGNSALHMAADNGNIGILQCLVELGASYEVKNNDGKTPIALAMDKEH